MKERALYLGWEGTDQGGKICLSFPCQSSSWRSPIPAQASPVPFCNIVIGGTVGAQGSSHRLVTRPPSHARCETGTGTPLCLHLLVRKVGIILAPGLLVSWALCPNMGRNPGKRKARVERWLMALSALPPSPHIMLCMGRALPRETGDDAFVLLIRPISETGRAR